MPTSLAETRGGARLALVRELPAAARPVMDRPAIARAVTAREVIGRSVAARASSPSTPAAGPTSAPYPRVAVDAESSAATAGIAMAEFGTTGSLGRVAGAVVLVALLGTALLAAVAASATLAWAGH